MALLGQSRGNWPSIALLGHVELTKMQIFLERKNKNWDKNEKQNENKNQKFVFILNFGFCFHLRFNFYFYFRFCFCFRFCFSFTFLVILFKFYYSTCRPPYWRLFLIKLQASFNRTPVVAVSDFLRHQILVCSWIWFLYLTVAPVFALDWFLLWIIRLATLLKRDSNTDVFL